MEHLFSPGSDSRVLLIAAVVSLVSVASGNCSPLLGFIIFFAVYAWLIKPKLPALVLTLFAFIVVPFADQIFLMLEQFGLRVGSTQDSSAVSRNVLQVYGILLFLGQPFGYGLDFNSVDHADQYRSILSGFEYADRIAKVALHNYFLMVLNKYGALILIVAFLVAKRAMRTGLFVIAFIPYMVHIFYHNDGPYQGDYLIWFLVPLFSRIDVIKWPKSVARRRGAPRVIKQRSSGRPSEMSRPGATP